MTTALDGILDALRDSTGHPRQSGGQWQARCPAHEDRNPSLSVRPIEGSVLVHCHAGCQLVDVLAALNMTPRDLYDEPRGNELARYVYTDAAGKPTRTVHRLDGKQFKQSGDKARCQLYRLPKVVEAVAAGRTVYLVEGEKDVHAIESLGEVATTAPQGASNFGEVDVSPLQGAQVIAVVDRDAAGEKWASIVRERLGGYAAELRLVEAVEGKDAADHIISGHKLDEFVPRDTAPAEVWGTPVPVDEIDRTPLPDSEGRYPAELWAFVDAVAEALQVPRDMVFLLVLSILSTASGGRWRARVAPDWVETLAVYTATSMPSGSRKSGTVKAVAAPIYEVERDLVAEVGPKVAAQQALREMRTAEVEQVKRKASKGVADESDLLAAVLAVDEIDVPVIPRLLADDVTPERLGGLMSEQGGRMGVISAEGGLFAILAGRYSSGQPNLDLVLKAHAGDPARVDRTSRPPLMLDEPFLAIGVTIQPDILEGLADTRLFRGSGLLARFFYALPANLVGRRKLDPNPIPPQVAKAYTTRVHALALAAWTRADTGELHLDAEAATYLRSFREELEPKLDPYGGELAEVVDWASKLPGALVRVAALLTLFTDPAATRISGTAMWEAISLADYLTDQALAAFDVINGRNARSARPRAVLAWIRRKRVTEFTVRQVRRELGGQAWAQEVENLRDVLADLEDFGWIRRHVDPSATPRVGRPSERYDVNPAAHAPIRRPRSVNFVNAERVRPAPVRPQCQVCHEPIHPAAGDVHPNCEEGVAA